MEEVTFFELFDHRIVLLIVCLNLEHRLVMNGIKQLPETLNGGDSKLVQDRNELFLCEFKTFNQLVYIPALLCMADGPS